MSILKIVHLSDPHFGTILPEICASVLTAVKKLQPDLVLITGDITQRARRAQFHEAKLFTAELEPFPVIAVPGNHDIPLFNIFARLGNPYWNFKKLFKDQLEKDFVRGDVVVTGLNSTSRWRHVQGAFDLQRLESRLQVLDANPIIRIAAFHHPMDCAKPQDEKNLLKNSGEVIHVLDRHNIDLMVGGHIHDPYTTLSKVRYPATRRNMIISVAGTCTSWRIRKGAPNSFNYMEIDTSAGARIKIVRLDHQPNHEFRVEHVNNFIRDAVEGWKAV